MRSESFRGPWPDVHTAISDALGEGLIAASWIVVVDVVDLATAEGRGAIRLAGGGAEGGDLPSSFTRIGMATWSLELDKEAFGSFDDDELDDLSS